MEALLNRNIAQSTPARDLMDTLEGESLELDLVGAPRLTLVALEGRVVISAQAPGPASARITGTVIGALQMVRSGGSAGLASSGLVIEGDAEVAESFWRLLRAARPDFEEELSRISGDLPARTVANAARGAAAFAERLVSTLGENSSEYLQEESGQLPPRLEVEAFYADVAELRDDVERAQARLDRLEQRLAGDD